LWGRILGKTKLLQGKEEYQTNEQVGLTKKRKYASLTWFAFHGSPIPPGSPKG
jgi:hypothetical protein